MNSMNDGKLIENFGNTTDIWIKALAQYNFVQLCIQPAPGSWSLGQVYMHLINTTGYFIEQVKICLSTNDNAMEEASDAARLLFLNNDFPDEVLDGPPTNAYTPQPDNKEQLVRGLTNLKEDIIHVKKLLSESSCKGKTKHPGLHYFTAREWLHFAEMHLRHHLRQKKRIDAFLKTNSIY